MLFAIFVIVTIRGWRDRGRRGAVALSFTLAIVFAAATGAFAVASYQQYVRLNTWNYFYELDVLPNSTASQTIIVPVPGDTVLLAGLRLVPGNANWSFTETVHGRGLYIQFIGSSTVQAAFSEFAPFGSQHNTSLTMTNSSSQPGLPSVWIFYSGGGVKVHFQSGYWALPESEPIGAGWHLYPLTPPPVV